MAINFPTSLDNFTNPSSGNTLDSPSHSLQHSDINDAVEAMQRKVGVGTAVAGSASAGQVLTISAAGTSTWSTPTVAGMTLLNTTSFSGVTSFNLAANTFSSTYDNYKIVISDLSHSTGSTTYFRMRAAGSDATGANYNSHWWYFVGSSGNGFAGISTSAPQLWDNVNAATVEVFRPFSALVTNVLSSATQTGNMILAGGNHALTTSYDSMSFIRTSGTMTGKYSVYGYNI